MYKGGYTCTCTICTYMCTVEERYLLHLHTLHVHVHIEVNVHVYATCTYKGRMCYMYMYILYRGTTFI